MQKYDKNQENLAGICETSGYMLLKLNLNQLNIMSKCDLSVDDARYVPMYEEYLRLLGEGVPKERIHQYLAKEYSVSESTVKRVYRRLSQKVKP